MSEFINTADVIGDDEMCDQIIMRTVTEYKENRVTKVGPYAFYECNALEVVELPNATSIGKEAFNGCHNILHFVAPALISIPDHGCFFPKYWTSTGNSDKAIYDFASLQRIGFEGVSDAHFKALILRSSVVCVLTSNYSIRYSNTPTSWFNTGGRVYVPKALLDTYKAATNWSVYAEYFRAIEDYTVDGTLTGELDESKVEDLTE